MHASSGVVLYLFVSSSVGDEALLCELFTLNIGQLVGSGCGYGRGLGM